MPQAIDIEDELEQKKVEKLAAEASLMEGLTNITVEFGNDETGDPAMWLVFHVRPGFSPDASWLQSFQPYARQLLLRVLDSGVKRLPYRRFSWAA